MLRSPASGGERSETPAPAGPRVGTVLPAIDGLRPVPREFTPADLAEQVWRAAANVPPGSVVAVSAADGGVGRSTLVAAFGSLLALAVPGPMVAIDANPRPWGGLGERVGAGSGTVWDAFRDLHDLHGPADVQRWTRTGPTGLLALAGEIEVSAQRHPPTFAEAMSVTAKVQPWYRLLLLDLMVAEIRGVWRALTAAPVTVLVARATADSIQHTLRLLAYQQSTRMPVPVLAVMSTSPRTPGEVRAVLRQAATVAAAVHTIPYDPILATASPLDARTLGKPARRALLALAGDVLQRCQPPVAS